MSIVLGVDVSHYQGSIDWAAVGQTSYQFGLTRMTVGRTTIDETGRRNLRGMLDHLPVAGAYGVVGYSDPVEDGAKLLVDEIAAAGADPGKILVMLDAEDFGDGRHPTIDQVDRYARQLHVDLGRWVVGYVPSWWLSGHGYTVAGRALANCPWAPSHYLAAPWTETKLLANKPTDLKGFKSLGWLQYTSSAPVAGVATRVDACCFYGTLAELRVQLLGQSDAQEADMPLTDADAPVIRRALGLTGDNTVATHGDLVVAIHGGDPADPKRNSLDSIAATLKTILAAATAAPVGQPVTLTPEQLAELKAALPTLEGTAIATMNLAVSPGTS